MSDHSEAVSAPPARPTRILPGNFSIPRNWPAFCFLALSLAIFAVRGLWRITRDGFDFIPNYLATRAWLDGRDPYASLATLDVRGIHVPDWQFTGETPSAYFPAAFPVSLPFVTHDWSLSKAFFLAVDMVLLAIVLQRFARRFLSDQSRDVVVAFVGLALFMYSLQGGIALLQYSIPALLLAILAMTFDLREGRQAILAAACAAVALAFKPPAGIVAFLYGLVFWEWRFLLIGSAFYAILTIIGAVPIVLSLGNFWWLHELLANIQLIADWERTDIYCCVNAAPLLLHAFSRAVVTALCSLPLLLIPAMAWRFDPSRHVERTPQVRLTVMTLCGLIVLVALFARSYNLGLLLPALVLAVLRAPALVLRIREDGLRSHACELAAWAALGAFVQPISPLGVEGWLVGKSYLHWSDPARLIWEMLVVPGQTYLLLFLLFAFAQMLFAGREAPFAKSVPRSDPA